MQWLVKTYTPPPPNQIPGYATEHTGYLYFSFYFIDNLPHGDFVRLQFMQLYKSERVNYGKYGSDNHKKEAAYGNDQSLACPQTRSSCPITAESLFL